MSQDWWSKMRSILQNKAGKYQQSVATAFPTFTNNGRGRNISPGQP